MRTFKSYSVNSRDRRNFDIARAKRAYTLLGHSKKLNASRMNRSESEQNPPSSESSMSLEMIISVGVLGWLAVGMVLMGLGIW
jgi:hypothetical protein